MSDQCHLSPGMLEWFQVQPLFFNATAASNADGHVNLSPRGLDSLRILDPEQIAILDFGESGK